MNRREEAQCLVARIDYALLAIIWGTTAAYFGFVKEGREAIAHIGQLL